MKVKIDYKVIPGRFASQNRSQTTSQSGKRFARHSSMPLTEGSLALKAEHGAFEQENFENLLREEFRATPIQANNAVHGEVRGSQPGPARQQGRQLSSLSLVEQRAIQLLEGYWA